jgi:hypothetical protein
MLRTFQHAAWIAAFLLIGAPMGLCVGASLQQPSQQLESIRPAPQVGNLKNEPSEQSGDQRRERDSIAKQKINEYWIRFIEFYERNDKGIVAISTFFIALFTLALFVATYFLWKAGERHSERTTRAYIALHGGSVVLATVDNAPGFHVAIELKNFGLTPAYSFTTWFKQPPILAPGALPFTAPTPLHERGGASIIGPGSSAWLNRYCRFEGSDIDDVRSGKKAIFIWGGTDYTDNFGNRRHFIFRQRISGQPSMTQGQGWGLSPHPVGYDAN